MWSDEEIKIMKAMNIIAEDAEPVHIEAFASVCKSRQLDPIQGHAVLGVRSKKPQITITIDALRMIAARSGIPFVTQRGHVINEQGESVSAWAEVYIQGFEKPFREEVLFSEFAQKNKWGELRGVWATMPCQMLKKCAEAAVLRMAFPSICSGLYIKDEMPSSDVTSLPPPAASAPVEPTLEEVMAKIVDVLANKFKAKTKADRAFWFTTVTGMNTSLDKNITELLAALEKLAAYEIPPAPPNEGGEEAVF